MQMMNAINENNKSGYLREKSPTSIIDGTSVGLMNAKARIPIAANNGCTTINAEIMSSVVSISKPIDGRFAEDSRDVRMKVVPIAATTTAMGTLNRAVM